MPSQQSPGDSPGRPPSQRSGPQQNPGQARASRTRVSGVGAGRLSALAVAAGAALLLAIVAAASLRPPPDPGSIPPAREPSAQPTPAIVAERLYVFGRDIGPGREAALAVYEAGRRTPSAAVPGALDGVLARDGNRLFMLFSDHIAAIDASAMLLGGAEIWRYDGGQATAGGALALSIDQRTLAWYRTDQAGAASIVWLDAVSGLPNAPPLDLQNPPREGARLGLAADGSAYLFTSGAIRKINRATGTANRVYAAAPGQLAAALSPDGALIGVLENADSLLLIDARSQDVIKRIALNAPADELPQWPQQLAFSPRGSRLAITGARLALPYASAGRLHRPVVGMQTIIVDLGDGAIVASHREERAPGPAAAYAWAGPALYVAHAEGVARWDPADRAGAARPVADTQATITSILAGPGLEPRTPPEQPPFSQTPTSESPAPTPQAPIVTRPAPAPLAWVRQADRIVEYAADGSQRTVAERVLRVIPRHPQGSRQPPLLLIALPDRHPFAGAWGILDPQTGMTTALSMTAPAAPINLDLSGGFVLSPDGAHLAFLTAADPIPGDSYQRAQQLVRADLRSGAVEVLLDPAIFGALVGIGIERWEPDGLYLRTSIREPGSSLGQWIWRFDPDAAEATPRALLVAIRGEPNVVLDGRLIVYQPFPADVGLSELRLYAIADGSERIIYVGTFIDQDAMLIAPDGSSIAYLRPIGLSETVELTLYNRATGTASVLAKGLRGANQPLRSVGGSLVFASPVDAQSDSPRRYQIFGWRDGALLADVFPAPLGISGQRVIADGLSDDGGRLAELSGLDGQTLLRVSAIGGSAVILGGPPATVAVVPVEPAEQGFAADAIVYVP